MLVLNLPFKALMFLTLMRPSLVLFLVLWLKLVKDFLKVRCRDRKSGSAGMPRPISYAVFCLKKKNILQGELDNAAPSMPASPPAIAGISAPSPAARRPNVIRVCDGQRHDVW